MNSLQIYQWLSVLVLAALLLIPASNMIWVLSVRRLQRKLGRALSADEAAGQRIRARFIALFLVLAFSYLFNAALLGKLYG